MTRSAFFQTILGCIVATAAIWWLLIALTSGARPL